MHPEQGPVWEWVYENKTDVFERFDAHLDKPGAGAMRKISDETMNELKAIFDVTGGSQLFEQIENYSKEAAQKSGYDKTENGMKKYFDDIYNQ